MDLIERNQELQRRHPWEVSRLRFFTSILHSENLTRNPCDLLDIGSGDAWFSDQISNQLASGSALTCWDSEYSHNDAFPGAPIQSKNIRFTNERPSGSFHVILLLDVLEHVEKDLDFLKETVSRNLRADGKILISVPAWPTLFSEHDVQLKHFRRYTPRAGREVLEASGLEILVQGGLFHSLLPARCLAMLKSKVGGKPKLHGNLGDWRHGSFLSSAVTSLLKLDNGISLFASRLRLDIPGLSWWALCRKRLS